MGGREEVIVYICRGFGVGENLDSREEDACMLRKVGFIEVMLS